MWRRLTAGSWLILSVEAISDTTSNTAPFPSWRNADREIEDKPPRPQPTPRLQSLRKEAVLQAQELSRLDRTVRDLLGVILQSPREIASSYANQKAEQNCADFAMRYQHRGELYKIYASRQASLTWRLNSTS